MNKEGKGNHAPGHAATHAGEPRRSIYQEAGHLITYAAHQATAPVGCHVEMLDAAHTVASASHAGRNARASHHRARCSAARRCARLLLALPHAPPRRA
ncbi:hypothetical protein PAHAL_9G254600 [Panicum hallii]|uniref:Uncharacterized protein n=1 Tax=Panicum hallii TaxID=206008 RepID=A0A2T8I2I9_9POAL|nr:hypothetical protein PAHAL_9G254600 [Panicum hallii]